MSEETEENKTPEIPAPVEQNAVQIAAESGVSLISAADLVNDDTDAPVADNKLPPPSAPIDAQVSSEPGNVTPPSGKRRGRKPMTDDEKSRAKQIRDAIKAGKPAPDFSNLPGKAGASNNGRPPRDYYLEACNLFFPVSMMAGRMLGEHWSVPIVEKEIAGIKQKALEPTEEQKQYLANMARWLEYEQFPELNPRWGFIISSIGYAAPKCKTDPTPERLKKGWEWFRVKVLRRKPNLEARNEQ